MIVGDDNDRGRVAEKVSGGVPLVAAQRSGGSVQGGDQHCGKGMRAH